VVITRWCSLGDHTETIEELPSFAERVVADERRRFAGARSGGDHEQTGQVELQVALTSQSDPLDDSLPCLLDPLHLT
jgi:hypothetical protein